MAVQLNYSSTGLCRRPCKAVRVSTRTPLPFKAMPRRTTLVRQQSHSWQHSGRRLSCSAQAGDGNNHLGAELLQRSKDSAQQDLQWSRATVVENKEASADGSVRTLVLSVEDHVKFVDGRKVKHVQEAPRWLDSYKAPGQLVAVRYPEKGEWVEDSPPSSLVTGSRLFALSSSPYEARRDSAMLDAGIVELLVSRTGDEDEKRLAQLGPGALFEVSHVLGQGYSSLFNSHVGLQSALEEQRPLVMIGQGCRGIAPLRAALSWTPVQAHATAHAVSLFYVADSQASAAYLLDWDGWREAGVAVHPLYVEPNGNGWPGKRSPEVLLEEALFHREGGLAATLGANPTDAAVLMSGVPGDVAAHITRLLTHHGIPSERILFCDFM